MEEKTVPRVRLDLVELILQRNFKVGHQSVKQAFT